MAGRLGLTELQAEILMKIGEKYEKKDGGFVYGAIAKITEEATAFTNLTEQQVRTFFNSRRQIAKKYRGFKPEAGQYIPIKMLYGYKGAEQSKFDPFRSYIQAQQKDLEEEFARLKLKQDEIESQRKQTEETVSALAKVNEERDNLKMEIEDAHKHIASLRSEKWEIAEMLSEQAAKYEALKLSENQNQEKLQVEIELVGQYNRALKKKEDDLEARRSDLEHDQQRLVQELKEKDHESRHLKKKIDEMKEKLERERLRNVRYDPWSDPHELSRKCRELDENLEWVNDLNATLKSKCYQYQEHIADLEYKLRYYQAQCEKNRDAVPVETLEYWRDRCNQLEHENEEVRRENRRIIREKGNASIMQDVVDRAIYIDVVLSPIIDAIVDDGQRQRELTRAGLAIKIRFIGQYCFIEKNMGESVGNIIFYKSYINKWDGRAKAFCEFRNKVCHDYKYLESLQDEKETRVTEYYGWYKTLREELEPLENVIKDHVRLGMLKNSKLLSANQVTNRLRELRLLQG